VAVSGETAPEGAAGPAPTIGSEATRPPVSVMPAYQYAAIYPQWVDRAKALKWLDTAVRLRDPSVAQLKNDPLMDPLRPEPHFKAILKQLKFPTG
jgi:hypothetical protein